MITTVTARDAALPVELDEAKRHLRVMDSSLDTDIQAKLAAAIAAVENDCGRSIRVSTTLTQKYPCWPCNPVRFDRNPVLETIGEGDDEEPGTVVTYFDESGVEQTVDEGDYRVHVSSTAAGYLEFDGDFTRPGLATRDDAVTITFHAGYRTIDDVDPIAKEAVKIQLGLLFGNLDERVIATNERCYAALVSRLDPGYYR